MSLEIIAAPDGVPSNNGRKYARANPEHTESKRLDSDSIRNIFEQSDCATRVAWCKTNKEFRELCDPEKNPKHEKECHPVRGVFIKETKEAILQLEQTAEELYRPQRFRRESSGYAILRNENIK